MSEQPATSKRAPALAFGDFRPPWRMGWAVLAAVVLVLAPLVWAFQIEPRLLIVRHVTIESAAWSGGPVRIGVISDLHIGGPAVDAARVRRIVKRMNAETPDLVVLLGDYIDGGEPATLRPPGANTEIRRGLAALGDLRPPLGVAAVIGNHDLAYDADLVERALVSAGAQVLRDNAYQVVRAEGPFWVAGVRSLEEPGGPGPALALAEVTSPDAPVLMLTHEPDVFARVPARVALTMAGHSHCGQINVPFMARPAPSPASAYWFRHLYDVGGRKLYVTCGVGSSVIRARLRAPPEIVIVTLRERKS